MTNTDNTAVALSRLAQEEDKAEGAGFISRQRCEDAIVMGVIICTMGILLETMSRAKKVRDEFMTASMLVLLSAARTTLFHTFDVDLEEVLKDVEKDVLEFQLTQDGQGNEAFTSSQAATLMLGLLKEITEHEKEITNEQD